MPSNPIQVKFLTERDNLKQIYIMRIWDIRTRNM